MKPVLVYAGTAALAAALVLTSAGGTACALSQMTPDEMQALRGRCPGMVCDEVDTPPDCQTTECAKAGNPCGQGGGDYTYWKRVQNGDTPDACVEGQGTCVLLQPPESRICAQWWGGMTGTHCADNVCGQTFMAMC